MPLAELQLDVDAVGDLLAAARRPLRSPGNAAYISSGAAEKELVAFHPHAVRVGAELAGVDAQQHVLGVGVLAVDVVGVAGGHQRQAHPLGHVDGALHGEPLNLQAVVLDLDEVAVAETSGGTRPAISMACVKSGSSPCCCKSVRLNSPETQPLRQMMPSLWAASSSLSIRGLK